MAFRMVLEYLEVQISDTVSDFGEFDSEFCVVLYECLVIICDPSFQCVNLIMELLSPYLRE